jgi:hypothetical protein
MARKFIGQLHQRVARVSAPHALASGGGAGM